MKNALIAFRLTEQEKATLEAIAAKKDVPVSQLIRAAIREFIKQEVQTNGRERGTD